MKLIKTEKQYEKCKTDILYFCKFISIQTLNGIVPFKPRKFQKILLKQLVSGESTLSLVCRQIGTSTAINIFSLWKCIFYPDTLIYSNFIKMDFAKNDIDKISDMYSRLPNWITYNIKQIPSNVDFLLSNGSKIIVGNGEKQNIKENSIVIYNDVAFFQPRIQNQILLDPIDNKHRIMFSAANHKGSIFNSFVDYITSHKSSFTFNKVTWKGIHKKKNLAELTKAIGLNVFRREFECEFV